MPATLLSLIFTAFLLLFCPSRDGADAQDAFQTLISQKEAAVEFIAASATRNLALKARCQAALKCNATSSSPCANYACSGHVGETKCVEQPDLPATCGFGRNSNRTHQQLCEAGEKPGGILFNFDAPAYRTPFDTVESAGDGAPIRIKDDAIRRDICALKQMSKDLVDAHRDNDLYLSLYAGTTNGANIVFPGQTTCRDEKSSSPVSTCTYDPRLRPWYSTAASGPRDVVFLFDLSALTGGNSVLREALIGEGINMIQGLDPRDYVAIVAFDDKEANVLLPDGGEREELKRADESVKANLIARVKNLIPSVPKVVNVTKAMEVAFSLFANKEQSSNCTRVIVLMQGSQDECFDDCESEREEPCSCVSDIVANVKEMQRQLGGRNSSIVALTESFHSDGRLHRTSNLESLAQHLVCTESASGVWQRIEQGTTTQTNVMAGFYRVSSLALSDEKQTPFSSGLYEDFGGYGEVFTLALPVYDQGQLILVVGVDITLGEVTEVLKSESRARNAIDKYSRATRTCPSERDQDRCAYQRLRRPLGSLCAAQPKYAGNCYKFGVDQFLVHTANLTYQGAKNFCAGQNGTLLKIESPRMNGALAGLLGKDGTWLGLSEVGPGSNSSSWVWPDGEAFDAGASQFSFAVSDIDAAIDEATMSNENACVMADSRGTSGNWGVVSCERLLKTHVCQLRTYNTTVCKIPAVDGTIFDLNAGWKNDMVNPDCDDLPESESACSTEENNALDFADPLCPQEGMNFTEEDRKCCHGRAATNPVSRTSPSPTPPGSSGSGSSTNVGGIVGGAVSALAAIAVVVGAILYMRYRRNNNIAASAATASATDAGASAGATTETSLTPAGGQVAPRPPPPPSTLSESVLLDDDDRLHTQNRMQQP